jgi:uncharacterized iron-regulated protein
MLQFNFPARPGTGVALASLILLAACSNRPQAPQTVAPAGSAPSVAQALARLESLLPADAILLGEQHDAPEHQMIAQQVVAALATQNRLSALAIEMADAGNSTSRLQPASSEDEVRQALNWNERGWPWQAYGPVVMAAVRSGVPVLGANLPSAQTRPAMADAALDSQLPTTAMQTQQDSIRSGHCDLLPASQLLPMARVQIARDRSIAQTIAQAALPGKVVVLLAGSGHVNRELGVPHYLPATLDVRAVRLAAGGDPGSEAAFDTVWPTPPTPPMDYCAELRKQMAPRSAG